MKYIFAVMLLLATTGSMAAKPENPPGNNGNNGKHHAYGKEANNGNHYGNNQRTAAIPEAGTLALTGLGLAGLILIHRRRK